MATIVHKTADDLYDITTLHLEQAEGVLSTFYQGEGDDVDLRTIGALETLLGLVRQDLHAYRLAVLEQGPRGGD